MLRAHAQYGNNMENNSEKYRMQKLAGLITEEEYNTKIWCDNYCMKISNTLDKLKKSLKNDGYDIVLDKISPLYK